MVCRHQVKIAVQLATVVALVIATVVGYVLLSAERLIARRVIAEIKSVAPHWDVRVDDVRLDGAQARVFGLVVRPKGDSEDVLAVPEVVVSLNQQALANEQRFIAEHIELRQPVLRVRKYADGSLNLDHLLPLPKPPDASGQTVLTDINRATVIVHQADRETSVRDLDIQFVPKARERYAIHGAGRIGTFGDVQLVGDADVANSIFDLKLGGRLSVDDSLIERVASWHPVAEEKIASWKRIPVQVAVAGSEQSLDGVAGPTSLGLVAEVDLSIDLHLDGDKKPHWSMSSEIVRGQLNNPLFPLPLRDLSGKVTVTEKGVVVDELAAANGSSGFFVTGRADVLAHGQIQKTFEVRATDISLDGPLRQYLTPGLVAVHQLINPEGRVDLVAQIDESGAQVNRWNLISLEVRDAAFNCTMFPYPVRHVRGWAKQIGPDVRVEFTGRAGVRDVEISGWVLEAGPGAGFDLVIKADGIPIEAELKNALATPSLLGVKQAADALGLTGLLDGEVALSRKPHSPKGMRPQFRVDAKLREGSLHYEGFPYRLEDVAGTIHFDDEEGGVWKFDDLFGRRGTAQVAGKAAFQPQGSDDGAELDLVFDASSVPYDRALYKAVCHAVPDLKLVLDEVNVAGELGAAGVHLQWSPGAIPIIDLPEVTLRDGQVRIASFPYQWTDVEARMRKEDRVSVRDGRQMTRVVFEELTARHNGAQLQLRPVAADHATNDSVVSFAENREDGWQVRFNGIEIRDLIADQHLNEALPEELGLVLKNLNVQHPFHAAGDLLVSSVPEDPLRIAARGAVEFPGNDMSVGVDLTDVRGRLLINPVVSSAGGVDLNGTLDVHQARAFNMSFSDVRGPIRFKNDRLVVGSTEVVSARPGTYVEIPPNERLTAKFYGGQVGLDVLANVSPDGTMAYDIAATLADADLNQWAVSQGLSAYDLQGKMNGEVKLSGLSDDLRTLNGQDGYLTITQARMLDLPGIAKMTQLLNAKLPDDTAFRYAYFNFDVTDGYFDFDRIDLAGNNLSFVGKGRAYFRPEDYGEIDFNFASYVPPNNSSLFSKMMAGLGNGWVYVKLGGTVGNPVPNIRGRIPLFDGLGGVMQAIESGQSFAPRGRRRAFP